MDDWKPRVLVIGPGGVKGLMILGCLSPLEDSGMLNHVDTYCGVSIGAIIALLMIVGYTTKCIISEALSLDIFKDIFSIDLKSSFQHGGLVSNEPARKKLTDLVLNKCGTVPTLYHLYMKTGKSLITTSLNITDEKTEYLNPFDHPHLSCIDAVLYSMNIPLIYYQLIDARGKTMIDGAFGNPYPVDWFDNGNTNILGIYIKTIYHNRIHQLLESSLIQRRENNIKNASSYCRHISLECDKIDFTGLSMTNKDKAQMIISGYKSGKAFLTNSLIHIQINHDKYQYPEYFMFNHNQND
ncbi:MAG TPA: patatin-like phospholipase family protein [Candidatus Saccharimonadales bacterium]|nr:patatin-like phospholipase family protein [Candidatus Saccharimonadales bacterium]